MIKSITPNSRPAIGFNGNIKIKVLEAQIDNTFKDNFGNDKGSQQMQETLGITTSSSKATGKIINLLKDPDINADKELFKEVSPNKAEIQIAIKDADDYAPELVVSARNIPLMDKNPEMLKPKTIKIDGEAKGKLAGYIRQCWWNCVLAGAKGKI